jgi:hypothetical protein
MGEDCAYRILVRKTLGRPIRGGGDNIKIDFRATYLRRRYVMRMGGGWNWLRIMSSGRLWY